MAQGRLPSAGTDGEAVVSSDEGRAANTTTQVSCQPQSLAEFLQAMVDGPIVDALNINRGRDSGVRQRIREWAREECPGWLTGKARQRWLEARSR
jgi:hypothetical protein